VQTIHWTTNGQRQVNSRLINAPDHYELRKPRRTALYLMFSAQVLHAYSGPVQQARSHRKRAFANQVTFDPITVPQHCRLLTRHTP